LALNVPKKARLKTGFFVRGYLTHREFGFAADNCFLKKFNGDFLCVKQKLTFNAFFPI